MRRGKKKKPINENIAIKTNIDLNKLVITNFMNISLMQVRGTRTWEQTFGSLTTFAMLFKIMFLNGMKRILNSMNCVEPFYDFYAFDNSEWFVAEKFLFRCYYFFYFNTVKCPVNYIHNIFFFIGVHLWSSLYICFKIHRLLSMGISEPFHHNVSHSWGDASKYCGMKCMQWLAKSSCLWQNEK